MSVIIRLQNLPMSANASNIRRFFSGLSIPEGGVHIVGGNDGDAFIAFATDEDARKAMLLDRQTINSAAVRLFLSSKTEMQTIIESARSSALFPAITHMPISQSVPPQKTETMQALDVTAATLPTSFSSYRNGQVHGLNSSERMDPLNCPQTSRSSPGAPRNPPPFDSSLSRSGLTSRPPIQTSDHTHAVESSHRDNFDFGLPPTELFSRYDGVRAPLNLSEFAESPRNFGIAKSPQLQHNSCYGDEVGYARPPVDNMSFRQIDNRSGLRAAYVDPRHERPITHMPVDYERSRSPVACDRFIPQAPLHDRREINPELVTQQFRGEHYPNSRGYAYDSGNVHPSHQPLNERDFLNRQTMERDFSVRPPWLNDNDSPVLKRPGPLPDYDEYPRKRSIPASNIRPPTDNHCETDLVVRVTLPVSEVGIKAIFEILRGVHIIPKWGIRIEEDALQRPTGYIFIMMTGRDSFDKALACNGRPYKGFSVKVHPSSASDFFSVTDSNFRSKCPPEIARKLPPIDQPVSPPHHSDGCLEITEFPQDTSKAEIVRFLGAPGLISDSVQLAGFASNDKAVPQGSCRIRALVILPSPKDIGILLSVKPRPLRPDGTCPPVRLTAISRIQLDAYSVFKIDNILGSGIPVASELASDKREAPTDSTKAANPLSCAYLSGLSKPMTDSDVLRLFSSVLIPGDAIRMVGPDNTSAYIDFISENNCRRAIADITANGSKAKMDHLSLTIKAISRSDMEQRLSESKDDSGNTGERTNRPPVRDRDPRDTRNQWDLRLRAHHPPSGPFRRRSPPVSRPMFEDYHEQGMPPKPFEEIPHETFVGHLQRPRPPLDFPHSGPVLYTDLVPPRAVEHPPMCGPPRRPPMMDIVTVFISNLPPSVTPEQLANVMRDYYFIPGSIRLRRDLQGIPTGDALVDFRSAYDADRTIRELSGYRIAGRSIIMQHDHRPGNL